MPSGAPSAPAAARRPLTAAETESAWALRRVEAVTDGALGTCVLRCVKAHTAYGGGSEQLLVLREGELVEMRQDALVVLDSHSRAPTGVRLTPHNCRVCFSGPDADDEVVTLGKVGGVGEQVVIEARSGRRAELTNCCAWGTARNDRYEERGWRCSESHK